MLNVETILAFYNRLSEFNRANYTRALITSSQSSNTIFWIRSKMGQALIDQFSRFCSRNFDQSFLQDIFVKDLLYYTHVKQINMKIFFV
jgi:hypothetical protein